MAESRRPVAPLNRYPEVAGNTVDVTVGDNQRRQGSRFAEEQTWLDPSISGNFVAGAASDQNDHVVVEAKVAEGRGRYGAGNPAPSWATPYLRDLQSFTLGQSGERRQATPFPWSPRAGFNPSTISPLDGLAQGERPNSRIVRLKTSPGRGRRNIADCSDQ